MSLLVRLPDRCGTFWNYSVCRLQCPYQHPEVINMVHHSAQLAKKH